MADMDLLSKRLLEIDGPLFAVLDGAQFDDLPAALFDGQFDHRALYHNDSIGDVDRSRTAPQYVRLDRDNSLPAADSDGRAEPDILRRLLRIIGNSPAAVFWHYPHGGQALFRHLRMLNMVRIPRSSLAPDEQQWLSQPTVPFVFRHADANVMAQVLSGLNMVELSRLFGSAISILFAPDSYWSPSGRAIEAKRPVDLPSAPAGMLELSTETMARIADARSRGLRRWAHAEFGSDASRNGEDLILRQIDQALMRAEKYQLEQKDEIWEFIRLDLEYGPDFERDPKFATAEYYLSSSKKSAKERIFYASQYCDSAAGAR